jgi:hypothetical protein
METNIIPVIDAHAEPEAPPTQAPPEPCYIPLLNRSMGPVSCDDANYNMMKAILDRLKIRNYLTV